MQTPTNEVTAWFLREPFPDYDWIKPASAIEDSPAGASSC
jgi:hypothetical protein